MPEVLGEGHFVLLLGGLYIDIMAKFLKTGNSSWELMKIKQELFTFLATQITTYNPTGKVIVATVKDRLYALVIYQWACFLLVAMKR